MARFRIDDFRELAQHVRHLIAALAAADVDDDVGVGPLGELVLRAGLPRAKTTWDGRRAAFPDREECVDDALPRDERLGNA